jgi:hypothetical protein
MIFQMPPVGASLACEERRVRRVRPSTVCHQGCNRRRPWTGSVDPAGMVFTLDALHTNRRAARLITQELHAH